MATPLNNISDEGLMERVKQRDHRAFSYLVERHSTMFYGAAYRMVMNVQEAEDIVQEAFLKLWDNPMIWKADKGAKFTTWFYRIVTNLSIDRMRKAGKAGHASNDVEALVATSPTQEQEMIQDEQQMALDAALKSLPEKQLAALNLCFYEGVSNKDAADILEVSVKALESLLMRAKAGLKNSLYQQGILKQGEVA